MKKQFNLSEKIEGQMKTIGKSIPLEDVKEFIRLLKEFINENHQDFNNCDWRMIEYLDKLAGSKLVGEKE